MDLIMHRNLLFQIALPLFLFITIVFAFSAPAEDWIDLFNGSNLNHWKLMKEEGWKIEEGVLSAQPVRRGNYIWTKEPFDDFELTLEFKMSKDCNSGVFFRSNPENPVQGGFEIQILDSYGKEEVGIHDCGALYDAQAPSANAVKPAGQWNQMTLRCKGSKVNVHLNGVQVLDADLDRWTEPNTNPDGSPNKFKTALKDLPRTGNIGLQYHGQPVWYRNIKITRLQ
jgi:hypothetical protein